MIAFVLGVGVGIVVAVLVPPVYRWVAKQFGKSETPAE
jgi:hypothetical protein